ncbi:MAG: polysaccharide deacetylase family protein [Methanomassiliicoccaceae archaeon]|nr:polysaccharide deacetylase family protein [Methanomassiliicoccaceae archaeon]
MRRLCFTVDVDRDVNERIPGRIDAVSINSGGKARFTSSGKGTDIIMDMLDETGVKATFFAEAATLGKISADLGNNEVAMHGLDHEDMTGEVSGIELSSEQLIDIMRTSIHIIEDRTGSTPKGFRAPYMRTNGKITAALSEIGMVYDSSVYAPISAVFNPYDIGGGLKEIPVPTGVDASGNKITAYLWPMHEGIRTPDDYIRLADTMNEGIFTIATHSWHMVESRSGLMSPEQTEKNIANTKKVITSLLDNGFKAVRMIDAIQ